MVQASRVQRRRTISQFAADEIVIPEGRYAGRKWRPHFQPFSAVYFAEIDSGRWSSYAVTGNVQSGKSFASFVVPAIYHLCELKEPVILGAPTMDIARDKWQREIEPVFRMTRYADLLPEHGRGSRGGFAEAIELRNGAVLKFMSGHGGDEKRSSFTSRVVIITEADKMDEAGEVSKEASPVRQMLARTESYDLGQAVAYMECTVSIESGFIWREYQNGTASRLVSPCPHCGEWICPEREDFKGVQEAATLAEAEEQCGFHCPACDARIADDDRHACLSKLQLVHRGQSISQEGVVHGEQPRTRQLGFRWSAWHNAFWSTAKIAHGEWKAANEPDEDDAQKYQTQFVWVVPWVPPDIEVTRLTEQQVTVKRDYVRKGVLPAWADWLTVGIDVGMYWLHWVAIAWRERLGDTVETDVAAGVIDYGAWPVGNVKGAQQRPELAIEDALLRLCREKLTNEGFVAHGSDKIRIPECVLIDAGKWTPTIRAVTRSLDRQRFYTVLGRGAGQHHFKRYAEPTRRGNTIVAIGSGYHVKWLPKSAQHEFEADVDHWKSWFTNRLRCETGPGSLALYQAEPTQHRNYFKHITAEEENQIFDKARNADVTKWERIRHSNHFFDASVYASIAAAHCGVTLLDTETAEKQRANANFSKMLSQSRDRTSIGDIISQRYRRD